MDEAKVLSLKEAKDLAQELFRIKEAIRSAKSWKEAYRLCANISKEADGVLWRIAEVEREEKAQCQKIVHT